MLSFPFKWGTRGLTLAALALFFGVSPSFAQTGSVEGTVRNARSATRIEGAQVSIVGTTFTATTNENGYYRIDDVPVGTYTIQAISLGFSPVRVTNARISEGVPLALNFEVLPAVIDLDAVVVTGVVGETQKAKLPFTVDQVSDEDMQVPQLDALSAIQGKVAGATVVRGSGRPGSAPTVLLRGPTSLDASGRNQEPLYVVDGVILGSGLVDLDALDIESIEVVKGAAAASLYGSRAAMGVIQITTRRGSSLPEDEVRFTVRSEYGTNQLPGRYDTNQHHQYLMNDSQTKFIMQDGTECDWLDCTNTQFAGQKMTGVGEDTVANAWNTYVLEPWPAPVYDQVDRFFTAGATWSQYLSAEGRSGSTNFLASYTGTREEGVMPGAQPYMRHNVRVNVDQALGQTFRLSASTFYSRSKEDDRQGPLFVLTRMPAGADLFKLNGCGGAEPCPKAWQDPRMLTDEAGNQYQDPNDVWLQPDPTNQQDENPLYEMLNLSDINTRGRFLASANAQFRPVSWVSFDGSLSYDRLDWNNEYYRFKGYKTINPSTSTNEGGLSRDHRITETINASANVTFTHRFGDLNTRTQFRYLAEYDDYERTQAGGSRFAVADVPTLQTLDPDYTTAQSRVTKERADGYYGITSLDFKDRYILDGMVRNDGSSRFGPDARRAWYYRIAGAWRVSEDFVIPAVDELKLRLARGTAGGRPNFDAQYETYSVSGGQVTPVNLGNDSLKPEKSTETEAGIEVLMAGGRVGVVVNYSYTKTENQILPVPLPGFSGFGTQWQNAGTLSSNTWEASLDLQLIETRDLGWSVKVLFDRTRSKIDTLFVPPWTYGVAGQGLGGIFYATSGASVGTYYGKVHASSCADLLGALPCDEFRTTDDGILVWTNGEELAAGNWGEVGPSFGFKGSNQTLIWGKPFYGWGINEFTGDTTSYLPLGKGLPDFNMSFSTTLRWGGLSVYGLLDMSQGFDVYNQPQQWAMFSTAYTGLADQTGVPDDQQKPLGYYDALYQATGGLSASSFFIQDGSFIKLREVSVRYRFDRVQLASVPFLRFFDGIAISAIGRNLITWTDYNSYDPEVGAGGGDTGSAAIARVDGFYYPNFRTFTAAIELNF
jgi:TonB-linked SusC/RagA family outer membrane protein